MIQKFSFDKLVRDGIPQLLESLGARVHTRTLETEEYIHRLKDKLTEEVAELQTASDNMRSELADVLEVLIAIGQTQGITFEDILTERTSKRTKNGGFDARVYVDFIELAADNPAIDYYKARPDKYPEINDTLYGTQLI